MTEEYVSNKNKATFKTPDETDFDNLPDKEFKAIVIKRLTEPEKVIEEHRNRNKEIETNLQSNLWSSSFLKASTGNNIYFI